MDGKNTFIIFSELASIQENTVITDKFSIPTNASAHDTVAAALSSAKSGAIAPAMPSPSIHTGKQSSSAHAVPKASEHPMMRRFQRSAISDIRQDRFLQVIGTLCEKCEEPMSVQELNKLVPGRTAFKDARNSNDFLEVYTSLRFHLPDSDSVCQLEARVSTDDGQVKIIILSLEEALRCHEALEERYGKLHARFPLGESPQEMISYTCRRQWGEMRFSYTQERPDLLASIVFDKTSQ